MSLTPPESVPGPQPVRQPSRIGAQLSLFGTEAADPSPADLAGLLAGPAEVGRMGGTARLSIVVDDAWRVHVLVAELALRGLSASWERTADQRHLVRTSYASTLSPLAAAWLPVPPDAVVPERGGEGGRAAPAAGKRPPAGFHLDGRRLRLWLAAAGRAAPTGVLLGLGSADEPYRVPVGAALTAVGLPGGFLDTGAGGPAYRITGRRRLAHLVELVGEPPSAVPPSAWPLALFSR